MTKVNSTFCHTIRLAIMVGIFSNITPSSAGERAAAYPENICTLRLQQSFYSPIDSLSCRLTAGKTSLSPSLIDRLRELVPENFSLRSIAERFDFTTLTLKKETSVFSFWALIGALRDLETEDSILLANCYLRTETGIWRERFGIHFMTRKQLVSYAQTEEGYLALDRINNIQTAVQNQIIGCAKTYGWTHEQLYTYRPFFWTVKTRKKHSKKYTKEVEALWNRQIEAYRTFCDELTKAIEYRASIYHSSLYTQPPLFKKNNPLPPKKPIPKSSPVSNAPPKIPRSKGYEKQIRRAGSTQTTSPPESRPCTLAPEKTCCEKSIQMTPPPNLSHTDGLSTSWILIPERSTLEKMPRWMQEFYSMLQQGMEDMERILERAERVMAQESAKLNESRGCQSNQKPMPISCSVSPSTESINSSLWDGFCAAGCHSIMDKSNLASFSSSPVSPSCSAPSSCFSFHLSEDGLLVPL